MRKPTRVSRRIIKGTRPPIEGDSVERWEGASIYAQQQTKTSLADFMSLYATHPWVYACVNSIAQAMASVPWRIVKNGEEAKDHPLVKVFKRPNPHQSWFEFMEATGCFLELAGNAFWEEVRKEKDLLGMYALRPDCMKILPHPKLKVAGYRFQTPKGGEIAYDAEEITHLKYFSPTDDYWGVGPGASAQNGLVMDFWAMTYNKGFFQRGSQPGFVLETENSMGDVAYNRLIESWRKRHQGAEKSHVPAVLEEGLKYKAVSLSQKDMEFTQIRKMSREEILGVWRVPPVIVGLLEFANYSTSREQRRAFWMDNILIKLARIEATINATIIPEEEEGVEFKFITESIQSMVEDEQVSAQILSTLISHGIITINEGRKKHLNLPEVDWGNVWWAPVGLAPVDSGAHPTTPGSNNNPNPQTTEDMETGTGGPAFVPNVPGRTGPRPPEAAKANLFGSERQPFDRIAKAEPDWDNPLDTYYYNKWTFWKQLATPDVRKAEDLLNEFFAGQFERFRSRLKESDWPKTRAKTDGDGRLDLMKALPKRQEDWLLFFGEDEQAKLRTVMSKFAQGVLRKHGNSSLGQLGLRSSFDLKNPRVVKYLERYAAQRVTGINSVTRDILRRHLSAAVDNGESFKEVMNRVNNVFKGPLEEFRARRIARTEVVTLTNQAKLEAAKQSGVVARKVWISELLDSTRDSHKDIHGTIIPIDDKFTVKSRDGSSDDMDGPGDISASPENVVNCLCVLDYPPETQEFADLFEEGKEKRLAKSDKPKSKKRVTIIRDPQTDKIVGSEVEEL